MPTVPISYHVCTYSIPYLQSWLGFFVGFEGKMLYYRTVPCLYIYRDGKTVLLIWGVKCYTYDVAGVLLELKDPGVDLLLDELNIQDLLNLLLDLGVVGQQQGGQHLPHLGEQHQSLQQQQIYRDCTQRFCISSLSDPNPYVLGLPDPDSLVRGTGSNPDPSVRGRIRVRVRIL